MRRLIITNILLGAFLLGLVLGSIGRAKNIATGCGDHTPGKFTLGDTTYFCAKKETQS